MKREYVKTMRVRVLIPEIDNGRAKITLFKVGRYVVEYKYKYDNGCGFIFITQYDSKEHYERRLSSTGEKLIYSSADSKDNGDFGREIEFSIFDWRRNERGKMNHKVGAI